MALRACIDAGEQGGIFCVAAVAFGLDRAVKANREWERLLKGRTFHMTDLHARKGEFEDIEDEEVHAIMVGTVDIVRRYASFAVAVACDLNLVSDSLPVAAEKHSDMEHLLAAFRSTYGYMCHFAMTALGLRANENNEKQARQISYVFEKGDPGQRGLVKYLEFLGDEPHHKQFLDGYSLNGVTVAHKAGIDGIFHAADLIAWEWARQIRRHKGGNPMRKSLSKLVGRFPATPDKFGLTLSDGDRFFFRYFSPDRLAAPTAFFREVLVATTSEEVQNAFARYREAHPAPKY